MKIARAYQITLTLALLTGSNALFPADTRTRAGSREVPTATSGHTSARSDRATRRVIIPPALASMTPEQKKQKQAVFQDKKIMQQLESAIALYKDPATELSTKKIAENEIKRLYLNFETPAYKKQAEEMIKQVNVKLLERI